MQNRNRQRARRAFLKLITALAGSRLLPATAAAVEAPALTKRIPKSDEPLPVIGMGTSRTFDVADDPALIAPLGEVLGGFFANGGQLIDSSPMYGAAEHIVGTLLGDMQPRPRLFAATKVWTDGKSSGARQMERSRQLWGIERFDLMQVHNLLDWQTHLPTLREWKAAGRIRYLGVTTSHGQRHAELERIMSSEALDFVQFTYNIVDRAAEQRLLPLAAERGMAVIANRPFKGGALFRQVRGQALPAWAQSLGCANWAQFFLKFIVSHPAVTCAIPATTRVDHLGENMGALSGPLPDAAQRRQMADYLARL